MKKWQEPQLLPLLDEQNAASVAALWRKGKWGRIRTRRRKGKVQNDCFAYFLLGTHSFSRVRTG